ncbi:MAG: class II aldolase/adducin family protein [Bacteroidia bacterium]|nr:class II aldolase/adducin family protein [Bacteroidia bacterium]
MFDEGYIKFNCDWKRSELPADFNSEDLLANRQFVFDKGLIGFDERENVGFGNISERYKEKQFIISGTQTGHIKILSNQDLSHITRFEIEKNSVTACGPAKPSSESLTHASIYKSFRNINAVIHIHSQKFWNYYFDKLPTSAPSIPYGTPEMALAVKTLIHPLVNEGIFIMGGHKDGVISFGHTFKDAKNLLFDFYNDLPEN